MRTAVLISAAVVTYIVAAAWVESYAGAWVVLPIAFVTGLASELATDIWNERSRARRHSRLPQD